jgi:hypothetical protein
VNFTTSASSTITTIDNSKFLQDDIL